MFNKIQLTVFTLPEFQLLKLGVKGNRLNRNGSEK